MTALIDSFLDNPVAYLQGSYILAFVIVYLSGILTSFTPCVYPLIPVTVAYIGARGSETKGKAFALSVVYVLGMAMTYTALGGFAALTGRLFGLMLNNAWLYFGLANVFLLMGLSMLGLFSLSLPLPQSLARFRPGGKKGGFMAGFLIGAVSALVIGPCTAPVLAVLLGLIAAGGSVLLGMLLMFVFAFGMGTLLIVIGTFTRVLAGLPKSGLWMKRINQVFGWLMIGMGEYLLIRAGMLFI
ncbi:MAG: sulfite exporter TauE/SafE family protein [Deltaproteobacteria bacterium]|nr:sulfite exporter TauE/SafE family protein [Deltaproteobacteria bacterium]